MKQKLYLILTLIFMFGFSLQANAGCDTSAKSNSQVSFGTITVQKDLPIGAVIASVRNVVQNHGQIMYCSSSGSISFKMLYGGGIKTSISHVYATNIPGVGISSYYYDKSIYYDSPSRDLSMPQKTVFYLNESIVELVKTGPISSGELDSGTVGVSYGNDAPTNYAISTSLINTRINAVQCSISNPSINVHLDDVLGADLNNVGTTVKDKNFDIGLQCDASAKINIKLTGVQNTETSTLGVLQLSNAGRDDVAKGVGIQMLYDNTPIELNKNMPLKTSSGGQETFTFTARYYQTNSTVTTGSANATATLEITYQ
ncbi:fimbrial protein [Rahnella sp. Lac-M11]|uniref:Fimbrial protein n=1 Tax=Rahnella contaminans TaxID=2703882 RepID=A0A6M2B5W9_9GAMM|nr:fimbrial protein [Rahnella contaminans]NGX88726.1 fimbrial protein [Rahnella contaminans]